MCVCMYSYQPEGWLDPHTVLAPDVHTPHDYLSVTDMYRQMVLKISQLVCGRDCCKWFVDDQSYHWRWNVLLCVQFAFKMSSLCIGNLCHLHEIRLCVWPKCFTGQGMYAPVWVCTVVFIVDWLLKQALHHEGVWGSGGIAPCILNFSTGWG